jgi:hypothetical protein
MNPLGEFLAKLPLTEVSLKTSIGSYSVMERLDAGFMPALRMRHSGSFYTFQGNHKGNYFQIQCHFCNPDGKDAFPNESWLSVGPIRIPFRIETSPNFYGRVFDDAGGSYIQGHFGIPAPTLALIGVPFILFLRKMVPPLDGLSFFFMIALIFFAVFGMNEYYIERKGIIDFLKGLFGDVIRKD